MAWIKSFKNSSGGFDSFDWSIGDVVKVNAISLIASILFISLCTAILPAFILFIYSFSITRHRIQQGIVGLIACLFWIVDYQIGIFNWGIFHKFPDAYNFITTVNIAILIVIICTLFFDKVIIEITSSTKYGVILSWIGFPVVIYYLFPIASKILNLMLTMSSSSIWT